MITLEEAKRQISRLDSTVDFHWKTEDAIAELTSVLIDHADSESHAKKAITAVLSVQRECPAVSDLRTSLQGTREETKPQQQSFGCPRCHGTGFIHVYQLCTGTIGNVLAQDLPGGYAEAEALRDRWAAERKAWIAANPTGHYKPERNQYIGESAKRCGCGR